MDFKKIKEMKELVIIVILLVIIAAVYATLMMSFGKGLFLFFIAFCVYHLEYNLEED
jgi:flagellar basal body-associated protein FliL